MASGNDAGETHFRDGREVAFPRALQYLDHAYREPPRHGVDGYQNTGGDQDSGSEPGGHPATRRPDAADSGPLPEMRSIFAERVAEGFYINIEVNRAEAARYGLTVGDVQRVITSGIGGDNIAENVEGRERYPISVRYAADFRDNLDKLRQILVATPSNGQVPLGDLAKVSFSRGPSMIRDEDAALTGYVYIDLNTKDYGGFVERADKLLHEKLALPAGYSFKWSGEYEFELRAKERLKIILPVVFFVIFLLLYIIFHSVAEAIVLIFPTIYAMSGGCCCSGGCGYNFSVAVWVGYIALFGIAVETAS